MKQLEERLRYSTVLDPFAGIGSTAWVCLGAPSPVTKLSLHEVRNFVGFELKESYYRGAQANIARARKQRQQAEKQNSLFTSEETTAHEGGEISAWGIHHPSGRTH